MADYTENLIKFGWLTKDEMYQAIENGDLDQFDLCYLKDTNEQFIINASLTPIPIKSRLRIYGSVEAAIEDVQSSSVTYEGEIISVRDGEKFIAYVVNKFDDGTYYIVPIYSDKLINYNDLNNIPITNLTGSVEEPININTLDEGYYKIDGHFITPDGVEVTSIVGNFIIVDVLGLNKKKIKRISSDTIVDYVINNDFVTTDKYATESYVESKGYATEDYVNAQLTAFEEAMREYVQEYVATTCTLLIKHMIDEELDQRYCSEDDINNLFD